MITSGDHILVLFCRNQLIPRIRRENPWKPSPKMAETFRGRIYKNLPRNSCRWICEYINPMDLSWVFSTGLYLNPEFSRAMLNFGRYTIILRFLTFENYLKKLFWFEQTTCSETKQTNPLQKQIAKGGLLNQSYGELGHWNRCLTFCRIDVDIMNLSVSTSGEVMWNITFQVTDSHGTDVFTPTWMADFYGKLVGKHTGLVLWKWIMGDFERLEWVQENLQHTHTHTDIAHLFGNPPFANYKRNPSIACW